MAKNQDNVKAVSILSYFFVGIIWYFVDENVRRNPNAKFHVKQALNIGIIGVVVSIIFSFFGWFAFYSFGLLYWIFLIVRLGIFVLWLVGLLNAINMKKIRFLLLETGQRNI